MRNFGMVVVGMCRAQGCTSVYDLELQRPASLMNTFVYAGMI